MLLKYSAVTFFGTCYKYIKIVERSMLQGFLEYVPVIY